MLTLNGLESMSDEVAKSIARHQGELWLDGLTVLSPVAAKALETHQGEINGMDPSEWVASLENKNKN
jgi:hypothetical protein